MSKRVTLHLHRNVLLCGLALALIEYLVFKYRRVCVCVLDQPCGLLQYSVAVTTQQQQQQQQHTRI